MSDLASVSPSCTDYAAVTEVRAMDPAAIARAWQQRATRPTLRGNGRLMIVAADHPARGALAVGSRPAAMNSRTDLPVVPEMDRVMDATTMATLLLGGDPTDPDEAFASWEKALALPSVRGLIVGRTVLYPADDDVSSAVATAVAMVR